MVLQISLDLADGYSQLVKCADAVKLVFRYILQLLLQPRPEHAPEHLVRFKRMNSTQLYSLRQQVFQSAAPV